jgi:hypothetical protein
VDDVPLFPSPLPGSWQEVARRWGLRPEQLRQAVTYLRALMGTVEGSLELIEVQLRPAGERYLFRSTDPARATQRTYVDRPLGWRAEDERRAIQDLYLALRRDADP